MSAHKGKQWTLLKYVKAKCWCLSLSCLKCSKCLFSLRLKTYLLWRSLTFNTWDTIILSLTLDSIPDFGLISKSPSSFWPPQIFCFLMLGNLLYYCFNFGLLIDIWLFTDFCGLFLLTFGIFCFYLVILFGLEC